MTAPSGSDEPQEFKASDSPEHQGILYDSSDTEPETPHNPEREFVLMPLFRRIGELLGIRRKDEQEYIYEPATITSQSESTPASEMAATEAATPNAQESSTSTQPVEYWPPAEPEHNWQPAPETQATSTFEEPEPAPEPVSAFSEPMQVSEPVAYAEWPNESASQIEPSFQSETHQQDAAEVLHAAAVPNENLQSAPDRSARNEEITELLAPLREAAAKLSAAVSQAAEWLHRKEEEILKRAELGSPTSQSGRGDVHASTISDAASGADAHRSSPGGERQWQGNQQEADASATQPRVVREASADFVPQWDPAAVPALQRELAWRDERDDTQPKEPLHAPGSGYPPIARHDRQPGPQLVRAWAQLPFWKRIQWEQQFTPKRVALLGAFVMAVLLIAGITLARRPAAELLPKQTRTLQPGGVTLSTHSAASPTKPSAQTRQHSSQTSKPSSARYRSRAAASEESPDVVTRYYHGSSQKPSPIKQSTVAGVRHYSDMD